ncbi:hypothetical protein PMM47T1_14135 [Pseudomonas sp. M47T1]|uniref:hypothetical protein n=1 Tax=Pseudomonas sp. M47T1 TaxID=1179778 RepID=UPI0002608847|nr:hypothetical protein [Pseudomonas sp. M47T1]EIK96105.1 hypothetical protein PMM47T1_14135 [Pseudomonas sp. M47T1]
MNLVDCYVTRILGEPYRKFGAWWVDVEYDSWGRISSTQLMFRTKEAALAVTAGHVFQA